MTERKREPPRPRIRRREDPPAPTSSATEARRTPGGEKRHATIEVEADWLEQDEPPPKPRPAVPRPAGSLRRLTPRGGQARSAPPKPAPAARPAPEPEPKTKRTSRAKISQPAIRFRPDPTALPPLPPATRPRDKLAQAIPREEEEEEKTLPPRRRSKPPAR